MILIHQIIARSIIATCNKGNCPKENKSWYVLINKILEKKYEMQSSLIEYNWGFELMRYIQIILHIIYKKKKMKRSLILKIGSSDNKLWPRTGRKTKAQLLLWNRRVTEIWRVFKGFYDETLQINFGNGSSVREYLNVYPIHPSFFHSDSNRTFAHFTYFIVQTKYSYN